MLEFLEKIPALVGAVPMVFLAFTFAFAVAELYVDCGLDLLFRSGRKSEGRRYATL